MSTTMSFAAWLQANEEVFADSDTSLKEKKQIWETEMKRIAARTQAPAKALSQQRAPASGGGFSTAHVQVPANGLSQQRAPPSGGGFSLLDAQKPAKKLSLQRDPPSGGGFFPAGAQASHTKGQKRGIMVNGRWIAFTLPPGTKSSVSEVEEEEDEEDEEYEANEEDEEDEEDEEEDDDECKIVEGRQKKPVTKKPVRKTPYEFFLQDARESSRAFAKVAYGEKGHIKACNKVMKGWWAELVKPEKDRYIAKAEEAAKKSIPKQYPDPTAFKKAARTTASAGPPLGVASRTPAARALTPAPAAFGGGKGKEPAGASDQRKPAGGSQQRNVVSRALTEFGQEIAAAVGFGKSGKPDELQTETGLSVDAEELAACVTAYYKTFLRFSDLSNRVTQGVNIREQDEKHVAKIMVSALLGRLRHITGNVPKLFQYISNDEHSSLELDAVTRDYLLHQDQRATLLQSAIEAFSEYQETTPVDEQALLRFHDAAMSSGWGPMPSV